MCLCVCWGGVSSGGGGVSHHTDVARPVVLSARWFPSGGSVEVRDPATFTDAGERRALGHDSGINPGSRGEDGRQRPVKGKGKEGTTSTTRYPRIQGATEGGGHYRGEAAAFGNTGATIRG